MSLSINTNIAALGVLNGLESSNTSLQTTIQRLSTGLKINGPGDDPAGLMISQALRTQLVGMSQASQNTQTAINLAKTADGAIGQISSLLQTLRSLAVSSSNSAVISADALQANQAEATSIIQSINQIAGSASFGQQTLLDGTAGVQANITDATDVNSLYIGSTFGGARVQSGPVTVTKVTAATEAQINTNQGYATAATVVGKAGVLVINGQSVQVLATDTIQQVVNHINLVSGLSGATAQLTPSGGAGSPLLVQLKQTSYGSHFSVNLSDASGILNSTASSTASGVDGVFNVGLTTDQGVKTVTFTGGQTPNATGLQLSDGLGESLSLTASGNAGLASATQIGVVTAGSLQFQIGANAAQSVSLSLPSMFASSLGAGIVPGQTLASVDLSSYAGASSAINIIDGAINQVATAEGAIGSFQANVLQPVSSNLDIATQNATAAVSTIADADIAAESTNLAKDQVLQQSGLAILAQANQNPGQLLALLKNM